MPLLFRSWDEVDYVREKMRPAMEKKFLDKGFVVLAWGDAGWVRFFSKEPRAPGRLQEDEVLRLGRETEQQAIMKSLGYTPVPLETSDILPAIQTGMINAVPSTPTSRWPARSTASARTCSTSTGHPSSAPWWSPRRPGTR
jgi:TRAP-type C4-dicarboxylate transport system substrate-binding protein